MNMVKIEWKIRAEKNNLTPICKSNAVLFILLKLPTLKVDLAGLKYRSIWKKGLLNEQKKIDPNRRFLR